MKLERLQELAGVVSEADTRHFMFKTRPDQQQYDTANDIANGVYASMDIMRERVTADKVKIFVYISNRVAIEKANRRGEGKFNLIRTIK